MKVYGIHIRFYLICCNRSFRFLFLLFYYYYQIFDFTNGVVLQVNKLFDSNILLIFSTNYIHGDSRFICMASDIVSEVLSEPTMSNDQNFKLQERFYRMD